MRNSNKSHLMTILFGAFLLPNVAFSQTRSAPDNQQIAFTSICKDEGISESKKEMIVGLMNSVGLNHQDQTEFDQNLVLNYPP